MNNANNCRCAYRPRRNRESMPELAMGMPHPPWDSIQPIGS